MNLKNAIGDTIRELRTERGMRLTDLSSKSHVSIGHISDIERGTTTVGGDMIESLAHGLELTATELVGEIYQYLKENA